MRLLINLALIMVSLIAGYFYFETEFFCDFDVQKYSLVQVGEDELLFEVADNYCKIKRGLSNRDKEEAHGMIFIFEDPIFASFWMKDTRFPIRIGYVNSKNKISEVLSMEPYSEEVHPSKEKIIYAIEMRETSPLSKVLKEGQEVKIKEFIVY